MANDLLLLLGLLGIVQAAKSPGGETPRLPEPIRSAEEIMSMAWWPDEEDE